MPRLGTPISTRYNQIKSAANPNSMVLSESAALLNITSQRYSQHEVASLDLKR